MASIVQPGFPSQRPEVVRNETQVGTASAPRHGFDSTKSLSVMLLAAMVSALVVVADQLIDTWADGHLLAAWVALWLVGFAALALFAAPARNLALSAVEALNAWSARVARERAYARLWTIARSDPRVMAELTAAIARSKQ